MRRFGLGGGAGFVTACLSGFTAPGAGGAATGVAALVAAGCGVGAGVAAVVAGAGAVTAGDVAVGAGAGAVVAGGAAVVAAVCGTAAFASGCAGVFSPGKGSIWIWRDLTGSCWAPAAANVATAIATARTHRVGRNMAMLLLQPASECLGQSGQSSRTAVACRAQLMRRRNPKSPAATRYCAGQGFRSPRPPNLARIDVTCPAPA
jgi:hypothetical protein